MPKVLSLKKNAPAKNQKAITQFFKTANPSTSEKTKITPAKSPMTQEKCVDKRPLKRKGSSLSQVETIDITDDASANGHIIQPNCSQNGYHTPKKFKSEVHEKDRTPFKQPIRNSPQKENGIEFNEITENKNARQNNKTKNKTPEKIERKSRSPLTPVENNNLNHGIKTDHLSQVEEIEKNHENQKEEKKISPRKVLNFECQIEQKKSSSKKELQQCDNQENMEKKGKTPIKKALIHQDSVIHVSPKKLKLISEDVCTEDASPSKSGSTVKTLDFNDDMFQDEFGVVDFEEECREDLDLNHMQRCEVTSVKRHATRIELGLKNASNNQATCFLEGIWLDTPLSPGEVISVIASRDASGHFCVGNTAGLLVLRPDHLISSTSVVAGVFCKRKAVLQERYRGIDSANTAMTIGILVHELVQKALTERIMDASRLRSETDKIIKESIQMLYDAGLSEEETRSNMEQYIAPLASFMQTYMGGLQSNGKPQKDQWSGQIDKVLDIEENLCCPQLGLKGKIDATLQVTIHERKGRRRAIVPLELKSGKASVSAEHRGQLVLYGMMLSLLRNEDPTRSEQRGLLLYLKEQVDVREVSCGYPERRDLMMLRNQLVQYLAASPQDVDPEQLADIEDASCLLQQRLPDPVHHQNACQKCPYLTVCSLHLWHTDGPSVSEGHPLSKLQGQALGHLSPDHVKYFLHWAALLKMEERGQMSASPLHALWTDSAETRAKRGTCAANLKLKRVEVSGDRHLHTFERHSKTIDTLNEDSSRSKGPQEGEFSIVSLDDRPWIAAGVITVANDKEIAIVLERDLSSRLSKETVFHIDTYESYATTVQNLTNLGVLLEDSERSERLRTLIIDKEPPRFDKKLPREVGRLGTKLMRALNIEQQRAVLKSVAAADYALLQGLPGTGKTQTISVLIQMLVGLKQKVLVTAHTHSAVDNVLSRLPESLRVMRLGSSSRVAPSLSHRCEHQLTTGCSTPEELSQLYDSMEVVGVTCLGANHAMLSRTSFDVCIVDEATQVLQCTVLRPLFAAKRFVLVGDPEQLPPVVRSRAARRLGMEESLFHRLMAEEATSTLHLQYRMNRPLAAIANVVAYNGKLKCADQKVADAKLGCNLQKLSHHPAWVLSACSPEPDLAGMFLDVEPVETGTSGNKCASVDEACVVLAVVDALIEGGVKPSDIGVIAPYRQQVALLKTVLGLRGAEGSTVDQFQGRDKPVVLYSCTRRLPGPDQGTKEGEILNDQRRLAVSVTRAKHKLIVVGHSPALHRYEPLKRLISACKAVTLQKSEVNHVVDKYRKEFL